MNSEHAEQVDFFFKARKHFRETGRHYLRNLLFAVPNGGNRDARTAGSLKMEGVLAGVPDIFFAYPIVTDHTIPGLFLEMKKVKGGRVSLEQRKIMLALVAEGYVCEVVNGCDEAFQILLDYLGE